MRQTSLKPRFGCEPGSCGDTRAEKRRSGGRVSDVRPAGTPRPGRRSFPPRQVSWLAGLSFGPVFPGPCGPSDTQWTSARRLQLRGQRRHCPAIDLSAPASLFSSRYCDSRDRDHYIQSLCGTLESTNRLSYAQGPERLSNGTLRVHRSDRLLTLRSFGSLSAQICRDILLAAQPSSPP